jgi:hypothetical protein
MAGCHAHRDAPRRTQELKACSRCCGKLPLTGSTHSVPCLKVGLRDSPRSSQYSGWL